MSPLAGAAMVLQVCIVFQGYGRYGSCECNALC